jgi:hypothetical protein
MDKKILAHLASLTKSGMTVKAHRMGDIIDDLEELSNYVEGEEISILERAIKEILELRLQVANMETKLL